MWIVAGGSLEPVLPLWAGLVQVTTHVIHGRPLRAKAAAHLGSSLALHLHLSRIHRQLKEPMTLRLGDGVTCRMRRRKLKNDPPLGLLLRLSLRQTRFNQVGLSSTWEQPCRKCDECASA